MPFATMASSPCATLAIRRASPPTSPSKTCAPPIYRRTREPCAFFQSSPLVNAPEHELGFGVHVAHRRQPRTMPLLLSRVRQVGKGRPPFGNAPEDRPDARKVAWPTGTASASSRPRPNKNRTPVTTDGRGMRPPVMPLMSRRRKNWRALCSGWPHGSSPTRGGRMRIGDGGRSGVR